MMRFRNPVESILLLTDADIDIQDIANVSNRLARAGLSVRLLACISASSTIEIISTKLVSSIEFTQVGPVDDLRQYGDQLTERCCVVLSQTAASQLFDFLATLPAAVVTCGRTQQAGSPPFYSIPCCSSLLYLVPLSHKQCRGVPLVGYAMADTRESSLSDRSIISFVAQHGVCFTPLDVYSPHGDVPHELDAVLHMGTAYLEVEDKSSCSMRFSAGLMALEQCAQERGIPFIEPLAHVMQLTNRCTFLEVLQHMQQELQGCTATIRGPAFCEVASLDDIPSALARRGLGLPCVVKSQVACGLNESHQMAVLCSTADVQRLEVPLPAVLQEFVDHDALLHKVYVIGQQVFIATRPSIPNLHQQLRCKKDGSAVAGVYNFHSFSKYADLFSDCHNCSTPGQALDTATVNAAADWLRRKLRINLFGFDVLVDSGTGDHVVVDVNYFPTFKDVEDAPQALAQALKNIITS